MIQNPTVSIITPAYNASLYLGRLIESVRMQTWKNIEHLIIDDGSNDEGKTLRLLEQQKNIRWISRENKGQYASINEGLSLITGDILTIISADDYYYSKDSIEKAVRKLLTHGSSTDGLYGRALYVNSEEVPLTFQPPHRVPRFFLPYVFAIPHCSLFLWRESVIESGARWNERLRFVGDAEWILNLLASGLKIIRSDEYYSCYRVHSSQLSALRGNEQRSQEHKDFDLRHGVNPFIDFAVGKYLGALRRLSILKAKASSAKIIS
jgi:glycosyltransferase involved in cell wall biosynthesis